MNRRWGVTAALALILGTALLLTYGLVKREESPGPGLALDLSELEQSKTKQAVSKKPASGQPLAQAAVRSSVPQNRQPAAVVPVPNQLPKNPRLLRQGDRYAGREVVSLEQTEPNDRGEFTRTRILKVDYKYPLVRVEDQVKRDPSSGDERIVHRVEMVADHVLVRLEMGYSEEDLNRIAAAFGGHVRRQMPLSGLYLLAFDGRDPQALGRVLEELKKTPGVSMTEPDYLAHTM